MPTTDNLKVNYVAWLLRPGFETNVETTVASTVFATEFPIDTTR